MKQFHLARTVGVMLLVAASSGLTATQSLAIGFSPAPHRGTPSQATGGASRGFFKPTGTGAPQQATGGASRGFFKPMGTGAPQQATGGASRGRFFRPAAGKGLPRRASGGASRVGRYDLNVSTNPSASQGPAALVAMLPQNYSGTTIAARPKIMVYVPDSAAQTAVFSLKDTAGNMVYQEQLNVSGQAGMVTITLPANAPALTVGQDYQWYMALQVDGELNPSTPYVDGWIQRIEASPTIAAAMAQADPLQQAEVLGANGIWYDCAAKLAELQASQPDRADLKQHWAELLESVGLQEVSQVPLVATIVP
jgi:hypothetical protein